MEDMDVIGLVDEILQKAVGQRASDIHIEPQELKLRIRVRVDGMLQIHNTLPSQLSGRIITRLKIMAQLDIAQQRLPQDGRMKYSMGEEVVDIRISTFPTQYGEKIVMRLLYENESDFILDTLGFCNDDLMVVRNLLKENNGILLVTGSTGSGKSTTLFSMLREFRGEENNIVTIEDPIEHRMDGVSQSAINPKIGYTFATALRSILRQDPDIIMLGEIRDSETSQIAIRAAITGHLVLSTLHTADIKTAMTRLTEMGTEAFLVKEAVKGVINQKLIKKLCPLCKEDYQLTYEKLRGYNLPKDTVIYKSKGCEFCDYTGYKGRIGVYDVWSAKAQADLENYYKEGFSKNALYHLLNGTTSLEEFLRVAY